MIVVIGAWYFVNVAMTVNDISSYISNDQLHQCTLPVQSYFKSH